MHSRGSSARRFVLISISWGFVCTVVLKGFKSSGVSPLFFCSRSTSASCGATRVLARRLRSLAFCMTPLDCKTGRITDRVRQCAMLLDVCGFIECLFTPHHEQIRVETKLVLRQNKWHPPKFPAPSKFPTCTFQLIVTSMCPSPGVRIHGLRRS